MCKNNNVRELLGEARAIHFAMRHGQISYNEAKLRVKPVLLRLNGVIDKIAARHKVKPKYIKFQDLGRNI